VSLTLTEPLSLAALRGDGQAGCSARPAPALPQATLRLRRHSRGDRRVRSAA